MTYSTLKTTVAALALTAGTAWAADENMDDATQMDSAIPAIDEAELRTPANEEASERSKEMQMAEDDPQEVETLTNPQTAKSTMVPDSGVGVVAASEFNGMTVADLVGMEVETATGEDVGEIDYVIKDDNGYAAIVGVGGFLGLGEHDVIVPLSDFSVSTDDDDEVTLAGWSKEKLEAQPDVDEGEIEALDDDLKIEITS